MQDVSWRLSCHVRTVLVHYSELFRENGGWPDIKQVHKGFVPLGGPMYVDADTVRLALQDLLLSGRLERPLSHVLEPAAGPSSQGPRSSTDARSAGARLSIHPSLMAEPSPRGSNVTFSSYSDSFGTPSPRPASAFHVQGMAMAPPSEMQELPEGEEWQTSVSAFGTPEEEEEGARRAFVVLPSNGAGEGKAASRGVHGDAETESMHSAREGGLDSDAGSEFSLNSRFQVLSVPQGAGASRGSSLASRKETPRPQLSGARSAGAEEMYSVGESDDESEMSSESGSDWSPEPVQMPRAKVTVSPDRSPPPQGGLMLSPDWRDDGETDASGGTSEYGTDISWAARSV